MKQARGGSANMSATVGPMIVCLLALTKPSGASAADSVGLPTQACRPMTWSPLRSGAPNPGVLPQPTTQDAGEAALKSLFEAIQAKNPLDVVASAQRAFVYGSIKKAIPQLLELSAHK